MYADTDTFSVPPNSSILNRSPCFVSAGCYGHNRYRYVALRIRSVMMLILADRKIGRQARDNCSESNYVSPLQLRGISLFVLYAHL